METKSSPERIRFANREPSKPPAAPRVALICDFLEENWPSMDLVGDMLFRHLEAGHSEEIHAEQLRPSMRMRASALPWAGKMGIARNVDRFTNRFGDYPRWLRRQADRFDLFHVVDHSYAQLIRDLPPERTIVHCHDLDTFRCLLEPDLDRRPKWFRTMARKTLDGFLRAAHVICVSAATKTQLLNHGLVPEDRLSVIYSGVDPALSWRCDPFVDAAADQFFPKSISQGLFLLHVGSTIKRKRIDVLLQVFASIIHEYPQARLLRVGGAFTEVQSRLAADLGLSDKIVHIPFLEKGTLAAVYRKAAILLQPSDAEGFGLPVIEAMACGCPVVASDIPALREAGGSAASFCPVADVPAWSQTVAGLFRERQTCPDQWARRRSAGLLHAARFTWTETANEVMTVYNHVSGLGRDRRSSSRSSSNIALQGRSLPEGRIL